MMSDVWRIVVVASEETFNQHLVNSLRKDGYIVQGVVSGADAVRILWSDACDVVICDMKTPNTDAFELLQWLRAYRPNTRMIMLGEAASDTLRMQALESGAVSYLEKPLDVRLLKEELRRLLQQTGFSASLDSFDLLDVIQMVTMSRKSITLLVNTGLEERGVLRFQTGDLIWAEYGVLRGEEAFFALAAHKNGTVIHQPWNEQVAANVTQPLSRLIFQALQYRTKYANQQQYSGEIDALHATNAAHTSLFAPGEIDDSPFMVLTEAESFSPAFQTAEAEWSGGATGAAAVDVPNESGETRREKEWWEGTDQFARVDAQMSASQQMPANDVAAPTVAMDGNALNELLRKMNDPSPTPQPVAYTQPPADLPGWLTNQPTTSHAAIAKSAIPAPGANAQAVPATPNVNSYAGEWQSAQMPLTTTGQLSPAQIDEFANTRFQDADMSPPVPHEWSAAKQSTPPVYMSGTFAPANPVRDATGQYPAARTTIPAPMTTESDSRLSTGTLRAQQAARRNYAVLVSALQTLGYSVPGFIAAAVVTIEGQPIAQVTIDDTDISKLCHYFSTIQKSVLQAAFELGVWGKYEDTVITSAGRHILMRMVGAENRTFQVLMTTRDADPTQSLEMMASVEETLNAALLN